MALKQSAEDSVYTSKEEVVKMFEQEAVILKAFQELDDPHLIRVVASFQRGDKFYFMFEWAEKGKLREFWGTTSPGLPSKETTSWFLEQTRGICHALYRLHGGNTRHGDLKPENMLVVKDTQYPNTGRFVIADAGLAKQHDRKPTDRLVRTYTLSGTRRYGPPDALDNPIKTRSRLYDTWSVGCIILEFMIWLLWGPNGLKTFNDSFDKTFWQSDSPSETRVNEYVIKALSWMLTRDPRCADGTALGDLLRFIQHRLLVIKIKDVSDDPAKIRATAEELWKEVQRIRDKAVPDTAYLPETPVLRGQLVFLKDAKPPPMEHRPKSNSIVHLGGNLSPMPRLLNKSTDEEKFESLELPVPVNINFAVSIRRALRLELQTFLC